MTTIVLLALLLSSVLYLYMGYGLGHKNKGIADLFPIVFGKNARVNDVSEFSTSTAATTVSLATIILAYFELSGYFGFWLLWTALTTGIGMVLVSKLAGRIWAKLSAFGHRPSLHEFLGVEFRSPTVALVASLCTSIGFLLIFATELIVGSRFLSSLVPTIPEWVAVVFLCSIGFVYTLLGGFRVVIKTDQVQMRFIWGLIAALSIFYLWHIFNNGIEPALAKVPSSPNPLDFSWRTGLGVFLVGIAIMNIPTHLSNMSLWQRIAGAQEPEVVVKGLRSSIWTVTGSWALLSLLACFAYLIVTPENNQTLLTDLLKVVSQTVFGKVVLFFTVLGLYGAMLSTASTNLIAVTHTVSEDIIAKFKKSSLEERIQSRKELMTSRFILLGAAVLAIFLVEGLKWFGFSIADLVFSIYGGALALFPPILIALFNKRERLAKLSNYATVAVILGFLCGWSAAIYGKTVGNGNLIFLSPTISIGVAFLVLAVGLVANPKMEG